jgi:hypothetical protein
MYEALGLIPSTAKKKKERKKERKLPWIESLGFSIIQTEIIDFCVSLISTLYIALAALAPC